MSSVLCIIIAFLLLTFYLLLFNICVHGPTNIRISSFPIHSQNGVVASSLLSCFLLYVEQLRKGVVGMSAGSWPFVFLIQSLHAFESLHFPTNHVADPGAVMMPNIICKCTMRYFYIMIFIRISKLLGYILPRDILYFPSDN